MSSFFSFLPVDGWQRLMCDALWQSTLVAGLGWLIARFLVCQSAARAWLLLMTLIACAVVPLASMAARANGWTILPIDRDISTLPSATVTVTPQEIEQLIQQLSSQQSEPDPAAAVVLDSADHRPTEEKQPEIDQPATSKITDRNAAVAAFLPVAAGRAAVRFTGAFGLQMLGTIWLALSLLLSARLILGIAATRRILRNGSPCDDTTLLAAAAEAARRIGVSCPVVLFSPDVETPTIYAFGRARLLIPQALPLTLPSPAGGERSPRDGVAIDWIAAFSHELAHVARGDGWSRLAVECIRIALPLQPLIWLLRRSFHTACEEACDDWAVATGSNPIDLADTLTAWINRSRKTSTLAAIGMSSTKARTMRLLVLRRQPIASMSRRFQFATILSALVMTAGLAVAQTMSQSKPSSLPNSTVDTDKKASAPDVKDKAAEAVAPSNSTPPEYLVELNLSHDELIANYIRVIVNMQKELEVNIAEKRLVPAEITAAKQSILALQKLLDDRKTKLRPAVIQHLREELQNQHDSAAASNAPSRDDGSSATDQVEKSIAADSLIALYERRLAQDQSELDQLTKEPNPNLSPDYPNLLREQIADLKKRLEKRKAELRPLIIQQLQEAKANTQRRQIGIASSRRAGEAPYVIQPRDMLVIDAVQLVPKKPVLIAPFDQVKIVADPTTTKLENPISGMFQVDSSGEVVLGPAYGAVRISGLSRSEAEEAVLTHLEGILKDPAVSLVIDESRLENGIKGEHLVSADGSIALGPYGSVEVEGLTIAQAREAIEKQLSDFFAAPKISVQVKSGSSKVYYVFSWGAEGNKGTIERVPITGNDTVLDAIAHLKAGIEFTGAKLFIQRQTVGGKAEIIEVDLDHVLEGTAANRQILPGDRIFVNRRPPAAQVIPQTPAGKAVPRPTERKDTEKLHSMLPSGDPPKAWAEKNPASLPPYEIEPPDILLIGDVGLVPKEPFLIQPLDILQVDADPNTTKLGNPITGLYLVEPGGMLNLGPVYGKVKVSGLSLDEAQIAVLKQLQKMVKAPKVSVKLNESGGVQQVSGEHLVGPDGTINLGTCGQVYVAGLTIPQTKLAIEKTLDKFFEAPKVSVDVYANNSKVYYVIMKSSFGDNIQRFPVTGNETVLDAISQVQGLHPKDDAKFWMERAKSQYSSDEKKLEVTWDEITQGRGNAKCLILPGDRIFIDRPKVLAKDPKKLETPADALPNTTNF